MVRQPLGANRDRASVEVEQHHRYSFNTYSRKVTMKSLVTIVTILFFGNAVPASAAIQINPLISVLDNGYGGGSVTGDQIKVPCWYRNGNC